MIGFLIFIVICVLSPPLGGILACLWLGYYGWVIAYGRFRGWQASIISNNSLRNK